MTNAEGGRTEYTYDSFGNRIQILYPDGSSEKNEYSGNGLLLKKTDANGAETTYTYDDSGNQTSVTDALGNTTFYEYDANGMMTRMILPSGAEETYTYAATTGLLTETTDTAGGDTPVRI